MTKYTLDVAAVALQVIRQGLRMEPDKLTRTEKAKILKDINKLVQEGHDPKDLINAARFGMAEVWPFTEGQPWDSLDFISNITKAKSVAARLERAGRIPTPASELDDGE